MTNEALKTFKQIWKNRFDEDISDEVAAEKADKLIRMVGLVYKPMTEKEFQIVQERKNKQRI